MERKIEIELIEWKKSTTRMPLVLHGARQVGKTIVVKKFAKEHEDNFVYLNFEANTQLQAIFAKYAIPVDTVKIRTAYHSVPSQLAKENKKFQYKLIKSGARSNQYETAIDWLCASGIVLKCVRINQGRFPISVFSEPAIFKIYMGDVGLLCSKLGISAQMILSDNPQMNYFKGSLVENYVANALASSGFDCYYWESEGKAEVDFVIQTIQGECIPIEVKSSENVRSKSLNQYVQKYSPTYSIRISAKNFGFENGIKSIPHYACFCIVK